MRVGLHGVYVLGTFTGVYGFAVARMWWKPWRWKLTTLYMDDTPEECLRNLSKEEVIGLLKLYGVRHYTLNNI